MRALGFVATVLVLLASCSHSPVSDAPDPYAEGVIAQAEAGPPEVPEPPVSRKKSRTPLPDRFAKGKELEEIVPLPEDALKAAAEDPKKTAAALSEVLTEERLFQLVWLRHPAYTAARARFLAVAEEYDQARALEDIATRYRSFLAATMPKGAPMAAGVRRPEPTLDAPSVGSLRSQLADAVVEDAWHELRGVILSDYVKLLTSSATLRKVAGQLEVAVRHRELLERLERHVRSRVEARQAPQANLFAVEADLEDRKRAIAVLQEALRRERLKLRDALLLPELSALVIPAQAGPELPGEVALQDLAAARAPSLGRARARVQRATVALRLAERMSLPARDLGTTRKEPPVGNAPMKEAVSKTPTHRDASDGPRLAMLSEMEQRQQAMIQARLAAELRTRTAAATARSALASARDEVKVHRDTLVPLAAKASESQLARYAAREGSFLDAMDAARRHLMAAERLVLAEHARDLAELRLVAVSGGRLNP